MRRNILAVAITALLVVGLFGVAQGQNDQADDLVWRRVVTSGLGDVSTLADVATDGTGVVIATTRSGKRGTTAHAWYSPADVADWAPIERKQVSILGEASVSYGPDGFILTGPMPSWVSDDGSSWRDADGAPGIVVVDLVSTSDGIVAAGMDVGLSAELNAAVVNLRSGATWGDPIQVTTSGDPKIFTAVTGLVRAEDGTLIAAVSRGDVDDGLDPSLPAEIWRSSDAETWERTAGDDTGIPAALRLTRVGDRLIAFSTERVLQASMDGSSWTRVPKLDGVVQIVAPRGSGGIAIGDGIVATSEDGSTWVESTEPLFDRARVRSMAALDDGTMIVVGSAPGYKKQRIPAIWIGEPADLVRSASVEDSAARYQELAAAFNAEQERLDRKPSFTLAQARKIVKKKMASETTIRENFGSWRWPGEVSGEMATLVFVSESMREIRRQQIRARNLKQWAKALRKWDKLLPANITTAIAAREALDLPISKRLKKIQKALQKARR